MQQPEELPESPTSIDTGVPAPEKLDVRWLFDYEYLWLEYEAKLRGGSLKRDPQTGTWRFVIPKTAVPLMKEQGINDIIGILKANVNIITATGIIKEDRVKQWSERMQCDLGDMLYVHQEEYGLDSAKIPAIISTFMVAYETNLSKSIGGKALLYALQGERIMETRNVQTLQGGGGGGGIVTRLLGRR